MRRRIMGLGLLALSGCVGSHEVRESSLAVGRLSRRGTVYIARPEDGRYGSTVYPGSGDAVVSALLAAMLNRVAMVEAAAVVEAPDLALVSARSRGAAYLLLPLISGWEDRATEWSALPDRIEIVLTLQDAESGAIVDRRIISARSTWWTLGGDRPQDLLPKPISEYAAAMAV
ncbi:MAG: hypothetical protein JWR10_2363 [Rubritepida sp.]|nr:hypothetical protein [Rubritepida sp.]